MGPTPLPTPVAVPIFEKIILDFLGTFPKLFDPDLHAPSRFACPLRALEHDVIY